MAGRLYPKPSSREIDWHCTNKPSECCAPWQQLYYVSDHIPVVLDVALPRQLSAQGFLDSGSNWDKPDALTNSEWRDLLRKQWSGINVDALDRAVAQQQVDVEKEWKLFLACLDELTRKAFTHLASHHHDEHVRKEAAHKARASGMCGLEPCHKSRHPKRCGDLSGKGAMGVTKLRKRVARLYELKCCLMLRLQDDNPRKDQQTHTCHNLINRLALREHGWSVRNVCQALEVAKRDLSELEQKTRKARIDQWKRDFVSDLKFAGRWLRGRKGMPSPQIKPTNGPVACGNDEAVEAIRDYWTHFWRKVEETSPDPDTIAARLIANSASVSTVAWTIPSAQQFHKQASSMRGAAGGDGWAAEDTRHLPLPVWNWYRALVERWLESGELPRPLTHARCVFLSKNHKIVNGTLKPDDARPITVLSIWWRVLMSTWLRRDECRAWTAQVIHPDVAYGCGSDAQVLAAKVLDSYSEAGFLGSLDYTKCFDCLRPDATAQLLQHTGFHHGLAAPAGRMWTNHKRWLSYQGHVAAQPMSCPLAVSQGDHAGPLAAALWLSAGCRWVTSNSPSWVARNGRTSVFMDDRSFTASSVDSLKIKIQSWETWSTRVGLLESMSKAQVAAKSLRQKASIACNFDPSLIRPDVLFLGVASRSRPRTDHEKETQRLAMETERLAVLGSFKLGYDCFARYARMFATSAACYGWLARMPTLTASSKLWATIKIGQGRVRMANKWMRALILGGNSHLDIIAASNLFRAVWKLRVQGHARWTAPVAVLRKWFRHRGFQDLRPWTWTKEGGPRVELSAGRGLDKAQHCLREGWRLWCWDRFVQTGRHELASLGRIGKTGRVLRSLLPLMLLLARWLSEPRSPPLGSNMMLVVTSPRPVCGVMSLALMITFSGDVRIHPSWGAGLQSRVLASVGDSAGSAGVLPCWST